MAPMTPDEFRAAGHQLIDWIADYRATVDQLPVQSQIEPGAVASKLAPAAPEQPEEFGAVLGDLDAIVVPGLTHVHHPRFFGWFPANSDLGRCWATSPPPV